MVRIPEEYQEVEYIESTGTQYIELPFGFLDTDEIKIVACEMTMAADKFMVAPLRWETARRFAMVGSRGNRFVVGFGNRSTTVASYSPQQVSDTEVHIWTYKNKIFSIIDLNAFYEWQEGSVTQATANLRLFYGYNSPSKGRIYSYYHKKANENEINLIPCYRKSDNEIGMYDTVSKIFYTNSGTGTFLKGHNVYYDSINLLEQRRKILLAQRKKVQVTWNQAQPPFSTSAYRPYLDSRTSLEDIDNGIVKQIWSGGTGGGYEYTTRLKESLPIVQTDHIYYLSYMINPSRSGIGWGIEFAGGAIAEMDIKYTENTWNRVSAINQGVRNGYGLAYFGNRRSGGSMNIGDYVLLKSPIYIDLTQMFGSGNEPDLETFEKQCIKNKIDLTQSYPQDLNGTARWWVI